MYAMCYMCAMDAVSQTAPAARNLRAGVEYVRCALPLRLLDRCEPNTRGLWFGLRLRLGLAVRFRWWREGRRLGSQDDVAQAAGCPEKDVHSTRRRFSQVLLVGKRCGLQLGQEAVEKDNFGDITGLHVRHSSLRRQPIEEVVAPSSEPFCGRAAKGRRLGHLQLRNPRPGRVTRRELWHNDLQQPEEGSHGAPLHCSCCVPIDLPTEQAPEVPRRVDPLMVVLGNRGGDVE
jgi:hypothetical protein